MLEEIVATFGWYGVLLSRTVDECGEYAKGDVP
jgi:hypothetical protein